MAEINIDTSFVMDLAKELITMGSNIVVKREDIAQKYETLDTTKAYDQYSEALAGNDVFDSYESFDVDLLLEAGLTSIEISNALLSKKNIPMEKRQAVLDLQRAKVITTFVEQNNYYRMLNGKPFIEDLLQIYITDTVVGVDITNPLHLMTDDEIFILTNLGYIDTMIAKYPDRAYLKFLGSGKIDVFVARTSRKFDILRVGTVTNTSLKSRFDVNYELSRTYILNNYYKRRFSIDQTYFDAYIGFMILTNALIMTVNASVDISNAKEFTNDLTIKALLQSYNLDTFDDIPSLYRKKIADNIQSLIVSKGTDEVIHKIFNIFGFTDIVIRKFMLVKERLKDASDNYIFSYDVDGVTPIYSDMYDVYFAQVNTNSANIDNEIRRPENKLAYLDVVGSDIYWGGYETDEQIRLKLLKEPFNYIDTDYINVNTAYDMTKLSFEISYFLSMTLELKTSLDKLTLSEPFQGQEITLFYAITMLSAFISRKIGFAGDIITNPIDIAVVNKFNFDRSITIINNIMKKYNYTSTHNFAIFPSLGQFTQPVELINLYFKNKAIYDDLVSIKATTRNLNEYLACREILEYISQSKLSAAIYTKSDTTIATTYLDYLLSKNTVLGSYVESLDASLIDAALFKLLSTLEEFVHSDRFSYVFLKIPTVSIQNVLKTYMLKLINTFKAYTINVFSMSVTYNIDDTSNNIKILDKASFQGHMYSHNNIGITDDFGVHGSGKLQSTLQFSDELELIASHTT
jgi:hypothetical protein